MKELIAQTETWFEKKLNAVVVYWVEAWCNFFAPKALAQWVAWMFLCVQVLPGIQKFDGIDWAWRAVLLLGGGMWFISHITDGLRWKTDKE
jgi:hypothetical protein